MAAASARRRAIGALTLIGAFLFIAASPAAAADGDEPIRLTDLAITGMTADLDGDGAREIVVLSTGDAGEPVLVEVWDFQDARWTLVGHENVPYRNEDGQLTQLADPDAGVGLLLLQDGPIERPLVLTADDADDGEGCCLTISEVVVEDRGTALRTVPGTFGDASYVMTLDADGDRTDELLVVDGIPYATEPQARDDLTFRLLSRSLDGMWSDVPVDAPDDARVYAGMLVHDTDGVPGEELLIQNEDHRLFRFYGSGGGLAAEAVDLPSQPSRDGPYVVGIVGGDIAFANGNRVFLARWPRGEGLHTTVEREIDVTAFPWMLGSGPNARLVTAQYRDASIGQPTDLHILGRDLEVEVTVTSTSTRIWLDRLFSRGVLVGGSDFPWEGPIFGGTTSGEELFVMGGWLITLSAGEPVVEPVGSLFGIAPLGLAGPDDAWVLASEGYVWASRDEIGLGGGYGPISPLSVIPRDALFAPNPTTGLEVGLDGAVELGRPGDGVRQIASAGSFVAELFAPPGTSVWVLRNGSQIFDGTVGEDSLRFDIEEPLAGRTDRNRTLTVEILLVAPTGQVSIEEWQVDILREAPEVTAEARVEAFALEAMVRGTATPGANVVVDGSPIDVDEDGRFAVTVDAPLWPRQIVVTATDPVGNASTTRLEVVGFVDYRGWPWPVFLGLLTVIGGVVMFLRAPRWVAERARTSSAAEPEDDAILEELDGDLV